MTEEFSSQAKILLDSLETKGSADITAWSNTLKKKPQEVAIRELQTLLQVLIGQQQNPKKMLEVIESIRPGIHQMKLATSSTLNESDALLYLQVLDYETKLYGLILRCDPPLEDELFALAMHRKLSGLIQRQLLHYQHYLPIPEKEWSRIHRVFYTAIKKKLGNFSTLDKIYYGGKNLSLLNLYSMSLLLGCARLNRLSPAEIIKVGKSLQDWCALVGISRQPLNNSDNQLVVDLTSGSAPSFKRLFAPGEKTISCYLQVDKLIEKLNKLLPAESAIETAAAKSPAFAVESLPMTADIIKHLKLAWSEYIYREERIETDEAIQVCHGFASVFYHLVGSKTLKEFIGVKAALSIVYDSHEDRSAIERERSGDLWSAFLSNPDGELATGVIPPEFNFQHFFPDSKPGQPSAEYPCYRLRMTDTSSRGCCLQWTTKSEHPPEVGELIGLCRPDAPGHWLVGEIAWKDISDNGDITTGVKFLSTKAIPVAVDVPLRLGNSENYTSGLLLPPEEQLGTSAVVFMTPPLKLRSGEYVTVSQKGIEEKIHLGKKLKPNAFAETYECSFVIKGPSLNIVRPK